METERAGPEGVGRARALLADGQPVAVPSETVYGLAADALDARAVARVFEAKGRPFFDPLIVHLPDAGWLARVAGEIPPVARQLAARFWPGPLTMILPKNRAVPDLVTSGLPTVAVRVPSHPLFLRLLAEFGGPLAAPSANRFGRISPTRAEDVLEELGGRIPMVLDGGPSPHGIESTIVAFERGTILLVRQGPITARELEAFGPVLRAGKTGGPVAPGQLPSHYAPGKPMRLLGAGEPPPEPCPDTGFLAFREGRDGFGALEILSPAGDPVEAASRLFGAMRRLDASGVERIVAEPVPEEGVGAAIMDRLRRAAHR